MNVTQKLVVRRTRSKVCETDCAQNDMGERQTQLIAGNPDHTVFGFTSIENQKPDHRPLARAGLVCRRARRTASLSMERSNHRSFLSLKKKKITTSIE